MTFAKSSSLSKLSFHQSPSKQVPIHIVKATKFTFGPSGHEDTLTPPCDSLLQSPTARRMYQRRGSRAPSMFLWNSSVFNESYSPASFSSRDDDQEQRREEISNRSVAAAARSHRRNQSLVSMLIPHLKAASLVEADGEQKKFVLLPSPVSRHQRPWGVHE